MMRRGYWIDTAIAMLVTLVFVAFALLAALVVVRSDMGRMAMTNCPPRFDATRLWIDQPGQMVLCFYREGVLASEEVRSRGR